MQESTHVCQKEEMGLYDLQTGLKDTATKVQPHFSQQRYIRHLGATSSPKKGLLKITKTELGGTRHLAFPRKQQIPRRVALAPEYFTESMLDSQCLEGRTTTRCDVPGEPISLTRSTDTGRKKKKPKGFTFQDVAPKLTLIFINKPSSGESVPRVDCKTPGFFFSAARYHHKQLLSITGHLPQPVRAWRA